MNVGTMENLNLNLKPLRGKKLPSKVKTAIKYDDLKKEEQKRINSTKSPFVAQKNMYYSIQMEKKHFFCLESLTLDSHKEELGNPYSQIVLYQCSTCEFDNVGCGAIEFNPDPKFSLPWIVASRC